MAISKGKNSISIEEVSSLISDIDIVAYYLNITTIPILINSPLRPDNNPSFRLFSPDGKTIIYKDFSTRESGGVYQLLSKMWNLSMEETLIKVKKDVMNLKTLNSNVVISTNRGKTKINKINNNESIIQCKLRHWKAYDLEYWESFGINKEWLNLAHVYPISHKIVTKDSRKYIFKADKYAYVYIERKEGKTTIKIYQPFNTQGFKWCSKHDASVISLWTLLPEEGDTVCICASLKDALCLWANTGINSIALQGEGYAMSNTAINELKQRFKNIYICFDNDEPGIEDSNKLSELTGFKQIILPQFEGGKDISDYYKALNNKQLFKENILKLFNI